MKNAGYNRAHCLKIFSKDVMWFHLKSFLCKVDYKMGLERGIIFVKKKCEKAFMYIYVHVVFKTQQGFYYWLSGGDSIFAIFLTRH